jgi:hypothetical protein
MRRLDARLTAMERHAARSVSSGCPVCGAHPNAPVAFTIGEGHAPRDTTVGAEHCPGCGRVTWFTILFDNTRAEWAAS